MHRVLLGALVLTGMALTFVPVSVGGASQNREQPEPETYHWVLPVNQSRVDVATLHPNDCYVVQRAEGKAYFGTPSAAMLKLQSELLISTAHLVETREGHPECTIGACLRVREIASALDREFMALSTGRLLRSVTHRPSPLDDWYGGAYSDVGSDNRNTFSKAREQQMLFLHLVTADRGNCYKAKVPRELSIHVRDGGNQVQRTGVYQGFLYIEHHHPRITGDKIVQSHRFSGSLEPLERLAPFRRTL